MTMRPAAWLIPLALAQCAGTQKSPAPAPTTEDAYQRAVRDAESVEHHEVVATLLSVDETNPRTVWSNAPDGKRIRVVTWTNWNGFDLLAGQSTTLQREVWVTLVPELQDFCKALPTAAPEKAARLEQRLGLPPNVGKDRFVELWVSPDALFRPCPDPEVHDTRCVTEHDATVNAEHRAWFESKRASSYAGTPYPWTRLGYTYDWGGSSEVGFSEFVVKAGSTVQVHQVHANAEYCARTPN